MTNPPPLRRQRSRSHDFSVVASSSTCSSSEAANRRSRSMTAEVAAMSQSLSALSSHVVGSTSCCSNLVHRHSLHSTLTNRGISISSSSSDSSSCSPDDNNSNTDQHQPLPLKPSDTVSVSDSELNEELEVIEDNNSQHLPLPPNARVVERRDNLLVVVSVPVIDHNDMDEFNSTACSDSNNHINTAATTNSSRSLSTLIREEYSALQAVHVLDPSKGELLRDCLLRCLDLPIVQAMGLVVIVLIILDGAYFAFLLLGWQNMCDTPSRTNCQPRNDWYNWSIQVLMVLITYINVMSFPWRVTNFLHLTGWSCPPRNRHEGCSLYGVPDDPDVWFHIARPRRLAITCLLLLNNILQFTNFAMRLQYNTYALQAAWPGNFLTSVFFICSFSCAIVGGIWMVYEIGQLRKQQADKFGPGHVEMVHEKLRRCYHQRRRKRHGKRRESPPSKHDDDDGAADVENPIIHRQHSLFEDESQNIIDDSSSDANQHQQHHSAASDLLRRREHPDPTRDALRRVVVGDGTERAGFRMFAM